MWGNRAGVGCAALLTATIGCSSALAVEAAPWHGVALQRTDSGDLLIRRQVIADAQQWQQWLASPAVRLSPLARLTPAQRQAFSRSLQFRNGSLANYAHEVMLKSLSAADAYQVLGLFGIEHELAFLPGVQVLSDADRRAMTDAAEALRVRQNPFARTQERPAGARATARPAQRWQGN